MNGLTHAATALEEALKELLAVFGDEATTPEAITSLQERCCELTTRLVAATTSSTGEELQDAAPALRRAQRLNAIARGAVKRRRDTAGTLIASVQQARRTLGADAPVSNGTSCDMQA